MTLLGANIANTRKIKGLRSQDLAKLVGVKQPYISAIEKGNKNPSVHVLRRIASALDTTTSELLGETNYELNQDMKKLLSFANNLNSSQVDALIAVAKELGKDYIRDNKS